MNVVKQAKAIYIAASSVLLILGILLLILKPSELLLRFLMGAAFVIVGAAKIFGFFSNDLYKLAFQFDLSMGALSALVGVGLLVRNFPLTAFSGIASIYIMAESMFKIQTALDAKRFGMRKWFSILIAALAVGIVGVLILLNPFESVNGESLLILTGIGLILNASQNIWTVAYTVRVKAKKKNVEEKYEDFL